MTEHTPQQKAFIQSVEIENTALSARAGTGKTTTLVAAAQSTTKQGLAVAFNKGIAETLQKKMPPNVKSATLNSLGHRSVAQWSGKVALNTDKNFQIAKELGIGFKHPDLSRAVGIAKAKCIVPYDAPFVPSGPFNERVNADWMDSFLSEHDDLELGKGAGRDVLAVLTASINRSMKGEIDFDDQIYLPAIYDTPLPSVEIVLVDEAQDLSPGQVAMLHKIKSPRKHIVGDPYQAIYGFRGAGYGAFEWTSEHFGCVERPLTVSFRCPKAVVEEARKIVPDIEAAPSAPAGLVRRHGQWDLGVLQPGDVVLCRTNKPVIALAYQLIMKGASCNVLGRDIGMGLKRFVRSSKKVLLREALKDRQDFFTTHGPTMKPPRRRTFQERLEILEFFLGALGPDRTVDDFCIRIDNLFSDKKSGQSITLSSIHKAKGLEWPRVFFLNRSQCPPKWSKGEGQAQQEQNLIYVAVTRAMRELHYIEEDNQND